MLLKYIIALGVLMTALLSDSAPRYRAAGVHSAKADSLIEKIKPLAAATNRAGVLAGIGGFGAMIEIPKKFQEPILVCGADGVGTKLLLAKEFGSIAGLGIDLVAMCVNDILCHGAKPLFFADYYACGELNEDEAIAVINGIANGCKIAGCSLVGGETAEMPGLYKTGDFDLAGFAVGVVEKKKIIQPKLVSNGNAILGLASSGPHSNGFSLIRKIIQEKNLRLDMEFDGATLGEKLLVPTRIYADSLLALSAQIPVKGIAHITGGGLAQNVARILPNNVVAQIPSDRWTRPPIFNFLQKCGEISDDEMLSVFNCGIGMAVIVADADVNSARKILESHGEKVFNIGEILPADATVI